jgi:aspartate kinase
MTPAENPTLLVSKFGGSSLSEPEQVKKVARAIAARHKCGFQQVVVVSAMGKTTDNLLALAKSISPHPDRRELDMLLTTGERISMALLSMALHDLGIPSVSFTGSQAGILTTNTFTNAEILDVRPTRVIESLKQNKVVVLAGFQGVSPESKEITTLGRGGSDITAVAMAAALNAERCEIWKDVRGIMSADPRLVPHARKYDSLSLTTVADMCFWGAKVLHHRCVELAERKKVKLFVGHTDDFAASPAELKLQSGTMITDADTAQFAPKQSAASVNFHKYVLSVDVAGVDTKETQNTIRATLEQASLPMPQILFEGNGTSPGIVRYGLTLDQDAIEQIEFAFRNQNKMKNLKWLSSATVTFFEPIAEVSLAPLNIQPTHLDIRKISLTVFVTPDQLIKTITALHHQFCHSP